MRVLVADDHELVADAIKKYLKRIDPDVEVVAVTTFEQAMDRLRAPGGFNLIILDLILPDMPRVEGLTLMRNENPDVPIIMISGIAGRGEIVEALDRGAAGFIPKDLSSTAMVKALELVLAGERYVPSRILSDSGSMAEETGYLRKMPHDADGQLNKLTVREREVLSLLIKGCSNKEIARQLGVKEITAAFHLRGVFKKLGVSNRTQAAAVALRLGWERADA
jgi:DNA-binding NarL/FixJ family response regulator